MPENTPLPSAHAIRQITGNGGQECGMFADAVCKTLSTVLQEARSVREDESRDLFDFLETFCDRERVLMHLELMRKDAIVHAVTTLREQEFFCDQPGWGQHVAALLNRTRKTIRVLLERLGFEIPLPHIRYSDVRHDKMYAVAYHIEDLLLAARATSKETCTGPGDAVQ